MHNLNLQKIFPFRQKELEDFAKYQENEVTKCTNILRKIWTFRNKDNFLDPEKVSNLGKVFQHLSKIEYSGSKCYGDDNNHEIGRVDSDTKVMEIHDGSNDGNSVQSQLEQLSKTNDEKITKEKYLNTCKK